MPPELLPLNQDPEATTWAKVFATTLGIVSGLIMSVLTVFLVFVMVWWLAAGS
jgi:hypothetical protein